MAPPAIIRTRLRRIRRYGIGTTIVAALVLGFWFTWIDPMSQRTGTTSFLLEVEGTRFLGTVSYRAWPAHRPAVIESELQLQQEAQAIHSQSNIAASLPWKAISIDEPHTIRFRRDDNSITGPLQVNLVVLDQHRSHDTVTPFQWSEDGTELYLSPHSELPSSRLGRQWVASGFSWTIGKWLLLSLYISSFSSAFILLLASERLWIRLKPGKCHECGYDLHSNTSGICPECGTPAIQPSE